MTDSEDSPRQEALEIERRRLMGEELERLVGKNSRADPSQGEVTVRAATWL